MIWLSVLISVSIPLTIFIFVLQHIKVALMSPVLNGCDFSYLDTDCSFGLLRQGALFLVLDLFSLAQLYLKK